MIYRLEIGRALAQAMQNDSKVLIFGEGVAKSAGIFGTTLEPAERFPERVTETPLSESMITGACLGLALEGWKPVLVHARGDWLMTAMEHMVNTIAKWRQVHQDRPFSLVIRALVGRGWGQGPNHSQALHAMFAHVPGLRVLYLSGYTEDDAIAEEVKRPGRRFLEKPVSAKVLRATVRMLLDAAPASEA